MAYEWSLVVYNGKICGKPPLFVFEGTNVGMRKEILRRDKFLLIIKIQLKLGLINVIF